MKSKPFHKGDMVRITDQSEVYGCYSQMIKRHMQYAIHWAYKDWNPDTKSIYIVRGCYRHCMKDDYDPSEWCVVIEQKDTHRIYLISENGISSILEDLR